MKQEYIDGLKKIVGDDMVVTNPEQKQAYLYDEVEVVFRPPAVESSIVVKPSSTEEVAAVMKFSDANEIPVVVRGGGTGLCGGATPIKESIILSMERMNHVVEIDERNMMAVVEAGVTLAGLLEALEDHDGICFPVHPGDEGCQMGGMVVNKDRKSVV